MASREKEKKKKRVVSLACTFCKKRHLKCDGTNPCVQCVSRNEECIFESNKKRGRKAGSDLQLESTQLVNDTNLLPPTDESFHPMLIQSFIDRFGPIFPQYNPQAFTLDVGRKVNIQNIISWNEIQQLTVTICLNKSTSDLIHTAEYLIGCAIGARICYINTDAGDLFISKATMVLQMIGTNLQDPSWANQLILLHELTASYFSLQADKSLQITHIMQCYTLFNLYKKHITVDFANMMFFQLATLSTELEDSYHYIKKIRFSDDYSNLWNLLMGIGYTFSSIFARTSPDYELKALIFAKLLQYLRELESNQHEALPWQKLACAVVKCTLLHQLHEPLEDDPLHLLAQVLESPHHTMYIVYLLITIPRETIPAEMWEKCVNLLNQSEMRFPGFTKLLNTMSENGVELFVEDKPKELEQFLFNEEELQMLLNSNFVSSQEIVIVENIV